MGFYRIFPTKDTYITNRIVSDDTTVRATGSNVGLSPVLNVYAYEPEILSGTIDMSRILLQFDITELSGKIYTEGVIPSSSVTYKLHMFNMEHGDTIPTSFDLYVYPLSRSWDEGVGLDEEEFLDYGYANWYQPTSTTSWTTSGSDFLTESFGTASVHFDYGHEDLEADITDIVVNWLTGSLAQNGVVIKLGTSEEDVNGVDYFRKAFHGRQSKFVDRLPCIQAEWSDVKKDNRKNFAYDNYSHLYLYNYVRGDLTNLTEPVICKIRDSLIDSSASYNVEITASRAATGVYSASFYVENTSSFSASWYDVWFSGSRSYMTGTFTPLSLTGSQFDPYDEYTVSIPNLNRIYSANEEVRLNVVVNKENNISHVGPVSSASLDFEQEYIEKMYYSVLNEENSEVIIPFATGSVPYTQMSYDSQGHYTHLYMSSFVPGFTYRILFLLDQNKSKIVIDNDFTFKVI